MSNIIFLQKMITLIWGEKGGKEETKKKEKKRKKMKAERKRKTQFLVLVLEEISIPKCKSFERLKKGCLLSEPMTANFYSIMQV